VLWLIFTIATILQFLTVMRAGQGYG
jgi:hypothetical protein